MILVIDANIAIALAIPQAYSVAAQRSIAGATRLIAPDLLVAETANVLRRAVQAGAILDWQTPMERIAALVDELAASRTLAKAAITYALAAVHPAYDMFYIALASDRQATLVTADQKLARLAGRFGVSVTAIA